ncbi:MAG TPA: amidase [Deltaproteobacteria bacterium]|nr:amidase [Candidatus Lambdaproteobacteria bacterium]HIL16748.1 amidase [Deltaproteobacteria bacterium]
MNEYDQYDATGLAALIATGGLSASEVIEIAIARIEALNPALNAVVANLFDEARVAVRNGLPNGPLRGVPYLVKDLNTLVAGVPATSGSRAFQKFVPKDDSTLISRLRAAGLVILGKTNTPEFGLNICTAPRLFGPTRNPFDPERSAGGSSGGSACAVAASMVPAAHATDSGGSIRIPASNCGLFGLKPSRARIPLGHEKSEGLAGLSVAHAITHSVRDSAALLDATAGPMVGDFYSAPPASRSFLSALEGPLPKFRVALWTSGYAGENIASACQTAARDAARLCESLGCRVEEARPSIDGHALREAFDVLFCANIHNVVEQIRSANPEADFEEMFEPVTLACSLAAQRFRAVDYVRGMDCIQQAARTLGEFFENHDVLLTPTLANPPLPLGAMSMMTDDWEAYLNKMLNEIPFTPLFNATGAPAASVPLGRCPDGLPIGIQIGAGFGEERCLLRLARALEEAAPWHQRS